MYPKKTYEIGSGSALLYPGRTMDHFVAVKADLPCTTIVIHGVNDVGVAYGAVEAGLCAGMTKRLKLPTGAFLPNGYRGFTDADRDKLEDDPDAIFFKRQPTPRAHSFVIPFYWGYREQTKPVKTKGGQYIDRYGNRLDKDYSKEGGPFANATNSLPDMWNRGFGGAHGAIDTLSRDPLRPVVDAPGRLYMVLAAQRLAALIQMIRDYDADETVNIVAHSQGCMVSLLAQAFLLQDGRKPVDVLVMNNPPYSLEDDLPFVEALGSLFKGGADAAMDGHYDAIDGIQTLHARLQTLVNIVQGVAANKHAQPEFQALQGPHGCTVGTKWAPGSDRDNRGKVYLYFSPEDATVALNVMRGIGWQGVPDIKSGKQLVRGHEVRGRTLPLYWAETTEFRPLSAIGPHFAQRVFTKRLRAPASGGIPQPVMVGAPAPYDFALCLAGEERYTHVNPDSRARRGELHPTTWPVDAFDAHYKSEAQRREGLRSITGEALPVAVRADLDTGAALGSGGKDEQVDAIDAAIATTSGRDQEDVWQLIVDPTSTDKLPWRNPQASPPGQTQYTGLVVSGLDTQAADGVVNAEAKHASQRRTVRDVYVCVRPLDGSGWLKTTGQWLVRSLESPDDMRLRMQHATGSRSYHSAIFGSAFNHEHVTAYDLAIGQGKAVSNPYFRAYLCAVADWRLTRNEKSSRPILKWSKFVKDFADYYSQEPEERRKLIEGNCDYYSTGVLPDWVPVLPGGLPPAVVCETNAGRRIEPSKEQATHTSAADAPGSSGRDLA